MACGWYQNTLLIRLSKYCHVYIKAFYQTLSFLFREHVGIIIGSGSVLWLCAVTRTFVVACQELDEIVVLICVCVCVRVTFSTWLEQGERE